MGEMFKDNLLLCSYHLHVELPLPLVRIPQDNRLPSPHKAHPSVYQGSYKAVYHNHKLPKTSTHNIQLLISKGKVGITEHFTLSNTRFKFTSTLSNVLLVVTLNSCNKLLQHSSAQQIL